MVSVLLLGSCHSLDDVPIVQGEHCAEEREDVFVACVLDGDTVQVDNCGGESVRLLGVDAPEIAHDDGTTEECYGNEARDFLSAYLTNQYVRLVYDAECTDTYGRTLAYAFLQDDLGSDNQVLVNEWLIRQGYAEVYQDFDDIVLADVLYAAQDAAQADNLGLWAACN